MHTKKTNNTNKLIQISYYSALTKIQNFKKKKKKKIFVPANTSGIARYWPVRLVHGQYGWYFFRYETEGLYVPVCLPVRYISAISVSTVHN